MNSKTYRGLILFFLIAVTTADLFMLPGLWRGGSTGMLIMVLLTLALAWLVGGVLIAIHKPARL